MPTNTSECWEKYATKSRVKDTNIWGKKMPESIPHGHGFQKYAKTDITISQLQTRYFLSFSYEKQTESTING